MAGRGAAARSWYALLVALGVDNFGSGLFLPLALVYATRAVGLPLAVAGTVVSVGTMAGLLVPPVAGRLVDRAGPRAVVILAQLVQASGVSAYLVADGVVLTLVGAILVAAGLQLFYSALFALIADVSTEEPKDKPFALVDMIRSGCFGLGALAAAGVLGSFGTTGLRIVVGVDAVTFVACALLLALVVRAPHTRQQPPKDTGERRLGILRDRPFLALRGWWARRSSKPPRACCSAPGPTPSPKPPPRDARGRYLATFQDAFTVPQAVAPAVVGLFTVGTWVPTGTGRHRSVSRDDRASVPRATAPGPRRGRQRSRSISSKPVTNSGRIRMTRAIGRSTHGRTTCSYRLMSSGSSTKDAFPVTITLQPVCVPASIWSAS